MQGWISLHRKMIEWEWYTDANTMRLFIHLLIKANHTEKNWRGKTILRGQFFTSLDTLSRELCLSSKQIRTSLNKLIRTNEVASFGQATGRMITVINYDLHQSEGRQSVRLAASKGQAEGRQGATTNNVNNVNNEKKEKIKRFSPPSEQEVTDFMVSLNWPVDNGATARAMIDYYAQQGWKLSNGNMMKDWNAAARGWLRNQQKWDAKK